MATDHLQDKPYKRDHPQIDVLSWCALVESVRIHGNRVLILNDIYVRAQSSQERCYGNQVAFPWKPTLAFRIDLKFGRGCGRFPNAIVSYALKYIIVPPGLNRFESEDGAMWHLHNQVPVTTCVDAFSSLAPVDVGGGVAWRLTEEADNALLHHLLVGRGECYPRGIWKTVKGEVSVWTAVL